MVQAGPSITGKGETGEKHGKSMFFIRTSEIINGN